MDVSGSASVSSTCGLAVRRFSMASRKTMAILLPLSARAMRRSSAVGNMLTSRRPSFLALARISSPVAGTMSQRKSGLTVHCA
jgi:hypothetical protein